MSVNLSMVTIWENETCLLIIRDSTGIRTRYPNEHHNFFGDRISAPQRMAMQGTHQRIVPIFRPFFGSTKSATLQFCSVALSFKWVSCAPMNSARREEIFGVLS